MPSKLDRVYVRITDTDRQKIDDLCEDFGGVSASALFRTLLVKAHRERVPDTKPKKIPAKSRKGG